MLTTTSHRYARLVALAVVAVSLAAAVCANAAGSRADSGKVSRSKERRVQTSRSLTTRREVPKPRQTTAPGQPGVTDFEPRQKGYHILINKAERSMTIFVSGRPYRTYRVYLGFTPEGHKTRRGDGCTPEGEYYICKRNTASVYYQSLLVSYPSPDDAKKGVEAGLIGQSTLNAVISAYEKGTEPPQNTRLGGSICIHGEGSRSRPAKDWTAGCIAVTNEEMNEIFSLIPVGTPVTIRP